jgi:hypothetical protein
MIGSLAVSAIWYTAKTDSVIDDLSKRDIEMLQRIADLDKTQRATEIESRITRIETILEIMGPSGATGSAR